MPAILRVPKTSPTWLLASASQIAALARSGTAWTNMKAHADETLTGVKLWDPADRTSTKILACALVSVGYKYIATVDPTTAETYRAKCQAALELIPPQLTAGPFYGDTIHGIARNITPLVLAADIIGWDDDTKLATFTSFCSTLLGTVPEEDLDADPVVEFDAFIAGDGRSIPSLHEELADAQGSYAGAARVALALFLRDRTHAERADAVLQGWLGDTSKYNGFTFGGSRNDLTWQDDTAAPRGVNPASALSNDGLARNFDGIIPEAQRDAGTYPTKWLSKSDEPFNALQGAITSAILLSRAGFTPWTYSGEALKRAVVWLASVNTQEFDDSVNGGDDAWMAWVIDSIYSTTYVSSQSITNPTTAGKCLAYTDWLTANANWP